jgi:uncharacterized membrane protein YccC
MSKPQPPKPNWFAANKHELLHVVRTTVAAVASLLIGRLFRLPESYWAAITTIVVMQSTLGAAWTISKQRLIGTAIGATVGGVVATYASANALAFGVGIFVGGILCLLLHVERNAYRYTGITVAIVVLIARTSPAWKIALHRFAEISIGIAVALALTAIWPEDSTPPVNTFTQAR